MRPRLARLGLLLCLWPLLVACPMQPVRVDPSLLSFHQIRLLSTDEKKEIDFGQFYGRVVLVDFFASHCMPCLYTIPRFNGLAREFQSRGFSVVGIALETQVKQLLLPFLAVNPASYPIAIADAKIYQGKTSLGPIRTVPLQLLVDRCGRAHKFYQGVIAITQLRHDIETLLKGSPKCHS